MNQMNQRINYICLLLAFIFTLTCGLVFAEETGAEKETATPAEISTSLDLAYITKYVWRGFVLNDEPVIQPSLTFSHPDGLSLNFWGNLDTTNFAGEKGKITEIDYTLNYSWNTCDHAMNVGVGYFTYPQGGSEETGEIYLNTCFGGPLSPTIGANYDFKLVKGFYFTVGASQDCALPYSVKENPLALGLSAKVGYGTARYNRGYFGADKSVFNDLLLTASLPIPVSDKFTVTPSINYSAFLDGALKQAARDLGSDPTNVFGGVTLSYGL
jgi:uncharacterized protein (TIGR02001 family)